MRKTSGKKRTRADRFLEVLRGAKSVVVLTHDNPDPDAIASGWGIVHLIGKMLEVPARFVAGGIIARAENRMLVETLKPPLTLISGRVSPGPSEAMVLVDASFSPRIQLAEDGRMLEAVIDHHHLERAGGGEALSFRFHDIRPRVLSSSSIVACYLQHFSIEPSSALATALFYGIDSDATGTYSRFSRADRTAVSWLSQYSDPELLARIENPELPRQYYSDLLLALESCFTYGPVGFCFLPSAYGTEVVGEIADLLVRCAGIDRLLCAAFVGNRIVLSARTTARGGNATYLLGKTVEPHGATWGGHEHRAGGSILVRSASDAEDLEPKIRAAWVHACGAVKHCGERLVAKREILKALH